MDDDTTTELQCFFAALSDEERLRVAGVLAGRDATVQELAATLKLRPPQIARHLAALTEAGLVRSTPDGALTRWSLDVAALREQRKRLLTRERAPSPADEPGTPEWERSVLASFFDGERLKEIPANLRKRQVILAWLAGRFDPDARYPEREVNEIIKRHHPDASALRRELVDHRYMQRENGVYWRLPSAS
ncbi:MAG TPA: metalloregulator ArsR/SmtB family transcription factor [Thermomicrobiales bacterium]|nr:metalloregulator ArsR/SmtB family transcription factor [Thermomicrobiales bacterium]